MAQLSLTPTLDRRLEFHNILLGLMPEGNKHAYFQPPATLTMLYPCIVYQRDYANVKFANNSPYFRKQRYQVTIIEEDPDSEIPTKVAALPLTLFQRFFVSDNLNHDIYITYF